MESVALCFLQSRKVAGGSVCVCAHICVPWGSLTGWPLDPGSPWFPGSPIPPSVPRLPGGPICPGNPLSPLKKYTKKTSQRENTTLEAEKGSWRERTVIPLGQLTSLVAGATGVGLGLGEGAQSLLKKKVFFLVLALKGPLPVPSLTHLSSSLFLPKRPGSPYLQSRCSSCLECRLPFLPHLNLPRGKASSPLCPLSFRGLQPLSNRTSSSEGESPASFIHLNLPFKCLTLGSGSLMDASPAYQGNF